MPAVRRLICLALFAIVAAPAAAQPLKLTFWTTEFERNRLETIRYLANAYAAENGHLEIDVVGLNENDFFDRFERAQKTGSPPDLIDAGGGVLATLANAGRLDSATATAAVHDIGLARFYQGALNALKVPGKDQYAAVPFRQWVQGIWYRADWFAEAALPPPNNWKRLLAAARRFNDPDEGRYGIIMGTGADIYSEQIFSQLALSDGARLFDKRGRFAPDRTKFAETFAFYRDLAKNAPPGEVTWRQRDLFLDSRAAMMFYSTFIADDIALFSDNQPLPEFQTAAARPAPRFAPAGDLVGAVKMVSIIKNARSAAYGEISALAVTGGVDATKRDALLGLIRFLFRDDAYISWLHSAPAGMLPTLRDISSKPEFYRDLQGIFRRYGRARILKFMAGLDSVEPFGLFTGGNARSVQNLSRSKILPNLIKAVVAGAVTPAEAARRLSDGPAAISD